MAKKEKLEFDKYLVEIDPEKLRFSEDSLSSYIQTEGGYYDHFGAYLALAERNLQNKELQAEKLFSERFDEAKEAGSSDKLAEAKAKADATVVAMREYVIEAKYIVTRLKMHLKAWDKNHDNAQSMGHMLRKQMDKLNSDIMLKLHDVGGGRTVPGLDNAIEETVRSFDKAESGEFESELTADNLF